MTNNTIDQDARVTRAAVVRLSRHAAVRADLDAAPACGSCAPSTWAPTAVLPEIGVSRTAMTADKPSRPLGAASTHPGLPNQRRDGRGRRHGSTAKRQRGRRSLGDLSAGIRRLGNGKGDRSMDRLLSVEEAAKLLGTTVRFPRRLVAERRIRFVHIGRHVRIPISALEAFVASGTVEPDELSPRGGVA